MTDEKNIEKRLCTEVKKQGGLALKLQSGSNGYPDRIIMVKLAKIGFVEVKAPGKKPRPLQVKRINELKDLGFKVYVLDDISKIGGIINDIQST